MLSCSCSRRVLQAGALRGQVDAADRVGLVLKAGLLLLQGDQLGVRAVEVVRQELRLPLLELGDLRPQLQLGDPGRVQDDAEIGETSLKVAEQVRIASGRAGGVVEKGLPDRVAGGQGLCAGDGEPAQHVRVDAAVLVEAADDEILRVLVEGRPGARP